MTELLQETLEKEEVAQHFSSLSSTYNKKNYFLAGKRGKYPDIYRRHGYIVEMLEGLEGRALEIGCGSGEMLCELLHREFDVVGVDLSAGMIKASRELIARRLPDKRAEVVMGDVEHLCYADASFDVVVAAGVIEYLATDERSLPEIYRVLKPGGSIILSVNNRIHLGRPLTTARDLIRPIPALGTAVDRVAKTASRVLSMAPNGGIPNRRHSPSGLRRKLRSVGFEPRESRFYQFELVPGFLRRRYPTTCVRWEESFEIFSRTPLGYFGNQYLIRALKS